MRIFSKTIDKVLFLSSSLTEAKIIVYFYILPYYVGVDGMHTILENKIGERNMKKLIVSALCGLCLMGAFVFASQDAGNNANNEVAMSRYACRTRMI